MKAWICKSEDVKNRQVNLIKSLKWENVRIAHKEIFVLKE